MLKALSRVVPAGMYKLSNFVNLSKTFTGILSSGSNKIKSFVNNTLTMLDLSPSYIGILE